MVESPCIRHCAINQQQICSGCGRTKSEISNWRTMSEEEKAEVCSKARLRSSSMQQVRDESVSDDGQE